jgi:hypothetical protein
MPNPQFNILSADDAKLFGSMIACATDDYTDIAVSHSEASTL